MFVHHHSASRALIIAGLSGFFTLIQSREGPDRMSKLCSKLYARIVDLPPQ
jgi:hypothetical protein